MRPAFTVSANNQDVTAAIAQRLLSLTVTDSTGIDSDTLEIVLDDDPTNRVQLPSTGAELRVALGYEGALQDVGMFVIDEVELAGWPATLTVRGRASVMVKSASGKAAFTSQKTRSWPAGTTFGALCSTVAKEHGLRLAMVDALQKIALPHIDQRHESDLNLLTRLSRQYDAIFKPAGGVLTVVRRGQSLTGAGKALPKATLNGSQVSNYSLSLNARDASGSVTAHWHAKGAAKREEVKVGSGEPVKALRHVYKDRAQALSAANAELARRQRGQKTLSLTVPGNPGLSADAQLELTDLHPAIDGTWLIKSITHAFNPSSGYTSTLELELPGTSAGNASSTSDD